LAGDLLLRRGSCLLNLGRVDEAEQSFALAAAQAATDSLADLGGEATFRPGWSLLRMEDYARARGAFEQIRRREGDNATGAAALYWEAVACFRQGLYDQAAPRFREVLSMRAAPDSLRARARLGLGDSRLNLGDHRGAVESYRHILEDPGTARDVVRTAHDSLFECRVALHEWDQADSVLADLEQRFPEVQGLAERHMRVAEGYLQVGRYPAALESYGDFLERASRQDPRLDAVRFRMARCREEMGERAAAAAAFEALGEHEDFRDRSEALLRAGALRLALGQPREALGSLEKRLALELDPSQAALTHAYLAESYQELGERQAARGEWEKVASAGAGASDSLRAQARRRLQELGQPASNRGR
jgi:tetratricopeptide (TPR) repeat protein